MAKRSSKRARKEVGDPPSALKMVLKLSAKEHAESGSAPASPSASVVSQHSDDEGKPGNKRSRTGANLQPGRVASPVARKDGSVGITAHDFVPAERNLRDRHRAPSPKPRSNALQDTLLYLHRLIEKRDNQHFFAFPINDLIAPDYSSVINSPMDFSTMKDKIDKKLYTNIMDYKADVKLICVNAMNYNHPDTIYYKAAQRLLEYAMRTLSKDRLLSLRKNQPMMSSLTDAELSLHLDVDASDYIAPARAQKKQRDSNSYLTFEPVPDHLPAKDIIAIAKERAAEAEQNLARKQPDAKMGFLRMGEDGTTTLNILNPDNTGYISEKERVITLGEKVGKLKAGVPFLDSIVTEDDWTDAKPVQYLNYGPYSSGAPTYDSSFSSFTKEESDLVTSFYGSRNGLDYIQSLKAFMADSHHSSIRMIDDLANMWTGNKHSEAQTLLKENKQKSSIEADPCKTVQATGSGLTPPSTSAGGTADREATPEQGSNEGAKSLVDMESLKSIAELGIDTSFLDHFKEAARRQDTLDDTATQLTELSKLQSDRFSFIPTNDKARKITEAEEKTADELTNQLASIAKKARPGDVTDDSKLRLALGVGLLPVSQKSDSQVVDELLDNDGESVGDNITHADALCHTIPLDESPSTSTS